MSNLPLYMLVQRSVALLQAHVPPEGYFGAFSGGKDSVVIKHLAALAHVPVQWHYHMTTIDPPELVTFIRDVHADVVWDPPPHGNFFVRFERRKVFPTRRFRWCCAEFKERTPQGATAILGVRVEESTKRRIRYTQCVVTDDRANNVHTKVLPIRLWTHEHVWAFIHAYHLPYCKLYDDGWERLGCVGCPLSRVDVRLREFARWPRFESRWRLAFARFWQRMKQKESRTGKPWAVGQRFGTWENLWFHWLHNKKWPSMPTTFTEIEACS